MRETANHRPLLAPLDIAIKRNLPGVAKLLVAHGANVNDRPFLWKCAKHGRCEIARLLLHAGDRVNQNENNALVGCGVSWKCRIGQGISQGGSGREYP
mmetsp:Transcript_15159/g.27450  ORF Transcript_15159/g.27450 Transcript_15159/m.27450 type:complete len:98 (-) Transcript_15159:150-443(-)